MATKYFYESLSYCRKEVKQLEVKATTNNTDIPQQPITTKEVSTQKIETKTETKTENKTEQKESIKHLDQLYRTKQKILCNLYAEMFMPATSLSLYSMYLSLYNIHISPSYLDRVMRELITTRLVEKNRVGYSKLPKAERETACEREHERSKKNIYTLTTAGTLLVKSYIKKKLEENELGIEDDSKNKTHTKSCRTKGISLAALTEVTGFDLDHLESSLETIGITKSNLLKEGRDERSLRMKETKIFGKVCEAKYKTMTFYNSGTLKESIQNYYIRKSLITGTLIIEDLFGNKKPIPIYGIGHFISKQLPRTEMIMRKELEEEIQKGKINEEIVLGETWETLMQNILVWAKRGREIKSEADWAKQKRQNKLLIEPNGTVKKNFHLYSETGIEGMEIYKAPKENRSDFFKLQVQQDEKLKHYLKEPQTEKEKEIR